VHRDLTTNFVNTIFYIISDWFAILAMLRVHHHNYSKEKPSHEEANQSTKELDEDFTCKEESLMSRGSQATSVNYSHRDSYHFTDPIEECDGNEFIDIDLALTRARLSVAVEKDQDSLLFRSGVSSRDGPKSSKTNNRLSTNSVKVASTTKFDINRTEHENTASNLFVES
jgi:hypothetical protein